jgi:hypothetical protein
MNVHQPILPTTTIIIPNVYVLGTQTMSPSIGYTIVHVNYQTTCSQPIIPIVLSQTNMLPNSTYAMWYNVRPPFVPFRS